MENDIRRSKVAWKVKTKWHGIYCALQIGSMAPEHRVG